MPDPAIVPNTPTVNQGDPDAMKNIQDIFDRKLPEIKKSPTPPEQPVKATEVPTQPVKEPAKEVKAPPQEVPDQVHLPSIFEEALKGEPVKEPKELQDQDWPEELPTQRAREDYKKWRESWFERGRQIKELKTQLEASGKFGPEAQARMKQLEEHNAQMSQTLSRMGVEQNPRFQQEVLAPMQYHYQRAKQIVNEVGGDPGSLDRALSLQGRDHYNAMDELLSGIPESAKARINSELGEFQRLNEIRVTQLQRAPETLARYQKDQQAAQYQTLHNQKQQMTEMLDQMLGEMSERVEVFKEDTDVPAWNQRAKTMKDAIRTMVMENTDINKFARAVALGHATDSYRQLFQNMLKRALKAEKELAAVRGAEPTIEAGPESTGTYTPEQDLKRPVKDVFLEILHREAQK